MQFIDKKHFICYTNIRSLTYAIELYNCDSKGATEIMKVFIDADGCPVVDLTIRIAKGHGISCFILCDTSHFFERDGATTITVSKGPDSVDFVIANIVKSGDIVITQDYGLAAMCLARQAIPINQNGMVYTDENIIGLLEQRHMAQKIRKSGGKLKGASKRTETQNTEFGSALSKLLGNIIL